MLDYFLLNTEIQASQPHRFNKTIFSNPFMKVDYRFPCFSEKWLQLSAMYMGDAHKRWEAGVLQPIKWKHHWFQFLCGFMLWSSHVGLPQETGTRPSRNNCITQSALSNIKDGNIWQWKKTPKNSNAASGLLIQCSRACIAPEHSAFLPPLRPWGHRAVFLKMVWLYKLLRRVTQSCVKYWGTCFFP